MHEAEDHRTPAGRYTLTETEHGRPWGVCAEVEGLFGEPQHGIYELFGWAQQAEVHGWTGDRVWLVPDDRALGPWLLADARCPGHHPGTDSLVLTGLDDHEGPPEGHRGRVRVHDEHRWLGSCQEFTRILAPERPAPPLVLRGLAPGARLRAALLKATQRALDLGQVSLETRNDRGETLAEHAFQAARVSAWHSSPHGPDLIDLELEGNSFPLLPEHARPLWESWLAAPPDTLNTRAALDTRHRAAWLDLVRTRGCLRTHNNRPAGHAYELDGRHITDEPGLHLALGEAVNGPGGYFGGCVSALDDCLRGTFGYTAPAVLLWRNAATARKHLSQALTPEGHRYDLFAAVLDALSEGGMHVTLT
ncbi:barstar family protein [Streptomyces sp. NPDC093094]|uniref:barstar family protein n=1 Tax=Streptomyces sp. NPDC093094 TaxID=3366026 RepID=UPI00381DC8C7